VGFLLLIICGKGFEKWNSCGLFVILISAIYSPIFNTITPTIIPKLKEKIMTKSDATIEIIIRANKEMGSPKMTARFLMFL
jgi:hypothetical protein|tara:strand:+ start:119 stop:361 length:243 start_codon:yes stop_codon:yes gene_type:complete